MLMSPGKVTRLHFAYRAIEALSPTENWLLTAISKHCLPVQIVSRFNHIQGKGVSVDQQY
jgi:hypothetical protein